MNKKTHKKETIENKNLKKSANDIGLDPEEQAMNGLYGMVETEYEDSLHDSQK
jgi:Protein of unknown function (DUF4021)